MLAEAAEYYRQNLAIFERSAERGLTKPSVSAAGTTLLAGDDSHDLGHDGVERAGQLSNPDAARGPTMRSCTFS